MKNVYIIFFALVQLSEAAVVGDVSLAKPPAAPDERTYLAAARSFHGGHWATSVRWLGNSLSVSRTHRAGHRRFP